MIYDHYFSYLSLNMELGRSEKSLRDWNWVGNIRFWSSACVANLRCKNVSTAQKMSVHEQNAGQKWNKQRTQPILCKCSSLRTHWQIKMACIKQLRYDYIQGRPINNWLLKMPTDIWFMKMPTDILNHNLLPSHLLHENVKVHFYIYIYIYIYMESQFCLLFCMCVKLGLSCKGKNKGWQW